MGKIRKVKDFIIEIALIVKYIISLLGFIVNFRENYIYFLFFLLILLYFLN